MLDRIKIGRTLDINWTLTDGYSGAPVTPVSGSVQLYDAVSGASIGSPVNASDQGAGVARTRLPATLTATLSVGQQVEARATINGEQESVFFEAARG
jgi:hypothetical protein